MPIEFRCPSCSKLLRTPDESAGKKAKCPQCASVVDVPLSSGLAMSGSSLEPLPPIPPAMGSVPSPSDKSPFAPSGAANPYASPSIGGDAAYSAAPVDEPGRIGLPWDRGPRSFKTYRETAKFIFTAPTQAFGQMAREGGLGPPITYALIGGFIGALFSGTYNTIMQIALGGLMRAAGPQQMPPGAEVGNLVQIAIQFPMALLMGTVGVVVGLFVGGAINHLFLILVGGAKYPFETTFRVGAYVQGTLLLMQMIPLCGQYVLGIVAIVYTILGLSAAHRISGGRAAAAVLLQIAICVGAAALVVGSLVVFIASQAARG